MINVLDLRDTDRVCGPGKTILETACRIDKSEFQLSVGVFMLQRETKNLYMDALLKRGVDAVPIRTAHQFDPRIVKQIIALIKERKIDVLHSHEYKSDILAFLVRRFYPIPIITTIHGWIANHWKGRLYIGLGKRVLPYFDRVIAVSPKIQAELIARGVAPQRIELIHNAIVMENYQPDAYEPKLLRRRFGIPDDGIIVGDVGRLSSEKGQRDFLTAAQRINRVRKDVYFVLIGDGPDRAMLEQYARELGIAERVFFTGHLQDVRPVYQDIDMLALTSYTEGFPNVLLESLSMNRPILATDVGGVADIVEDNVTGRLVQPGDVEGIANGLLGMIQNPDEARRLMANGRQAVVDKFQFSRRVERVQALYRDVVRSAGAGRAGKQADVSR
jgi:glycosyltransferase involved in cell wall biosynthesis